MEKLNIYEKIQKAKVELSQLELKKTGKNQSMKYFELGDFLPALNLILVDYKLFTEISFGDMAILTITNAEKPDERVTYTSPMAEAKLRNCHDVQNLGAAQTFLRRYLYMNAFDIVEGDILDATLDVGKDTNVPTKKAPYKLANNWIQSVQITAKECNYTGDAAKKLIKEKYSKTSSTLLTVDQAKDFVKYMKDNKLEVAK